MAVVERLDAEGIAGEKKRVLVGVPGGEGKHAPQASEAALAPARKRREQHLGVALGAEGPAGAGELRAQRAEVVDGAVEHERVAAVGRDHRLVAVGGIEDGEASHAEGGVGQLGNAAIVGAAVEHRVAHSGNSRSTLVGRVG